MHVHLSQMHYGFPKIKLMVLLYLSAEQRTFRGSVVIDDFDLTNYHPFLYESSHLLDIKTLILRKYLYGFIRTVTQVFE